MVPTVAVAQAWRSSRNANLARFLDGCIIEDFTNELARRAGELCGRANTSDIVDAAVIVSAARWGNVVITTDPGDLQLLAALVTPVRVKAL